MRLKTLRQHQTNEKHTTIVVKTESSNRMEVRKAQLHDMKTTVLGSFKNLFSVRLFPPVTKLNISLDKNKVFISSKWERGWKREQSWQLMKRNEDEIEEGGRGTIVMRGMEVVENVLPHRQTCDNDDNVEVSEGTKWTLSETNSIIHHSVEHLSDYWFSFQMLWKLYSLPPRMPSLLLDP